MSVVDVAKLQSGWECGSRLPILCLAQQRLDLRSKHWRRFLHRHPDIWIRDVTVVMHQGVAKCHDGVGLRQLCSKTWRMTTQSIDGLANR